VRQRSGGAHGRGNGRGSLSGSVLTHVSALRSSIRIHDHHRLYAETAVERELVLRLASLLWRLRRIIAIETDLFQIQAEILRNRRNEGL
jgi:hypothetical protein